jgi:hypothetical protein
MIAIAFLFVRMLCDCFKSRRQLKAEILVLRHQLNVLHQNASRQALGLLRSRRERPSDRGAAEKGDEIPGRLC